MHISIKVLGIKYPTTSDIDQGREPSLEVETVIDINPKDKINRMLFEENNNYVLVWMNGGMYICEPVHVERKQYSTKQIYYHPYADKGI